MPRLLILLAAFSFLVLAGSTQADKDLEPSPLKLPARELPLKDVLAELQKQTGNTVTDRRSERTNPKLSLQTNTFWKTLDAIGTQTGIGFSPYQSDGGVALVDTPYRKVMTHHSGLFRFAFKRIAVQRNEETKTHYCQITLDMAWEPRLAPFYVNLENATAAFGTRAEPMERQGVRGVAGAGATDIELRLAAPERRVEKITLLKGNLRVIAAPKMLEFAFDKLATGQSAKQEGVAVRLASVKKIAARWAIDMDVVNPPGDNVPLDSYQRVAVRNSYRAWLTWTDPVTKTQHTLDPVNDAPTETKEGMKIHFDFAPRGETRLPPNNADVTLRYRTPSRVTALTVPFEFRDLPLP